VVNFFTKKQKNIAATNKRNPLKILALIYGKVYNK